MEKPVKITRKKSRVFGLAMIMVFVFIFCFSSFVSAEMIPVTFKTTKDDLNIRSQPDTNSSILSVIDKAGTTLYPVERVTTNWYKIRFANNVYGYVFRDYVVDGGPLTSYVSLFAGSALRTSPSESAPVQRLLSAGTELTITAQDDKWYTAKAFNNEQGYILKSSAEPFVVTYPTAKYPDVKVDDIQLLQVTATSVVARASASTSAASVATYSKGELLTIVSSGSSGGYTWYQIVTPGGGTGYVRSDSVKTYAATALKGKKICIDPGHGSKKLATDTQVDKGNVGVSGTLEKDINLAIARYLQAYLNKAGANVIMTRTSDTGLMTLVDRATLANNSKADIFISVHANYSSSNPQKTGTITYYFAGNSGTPVSSSLLAKRKKLSTSIQNATAKDLGFTSLGTASDNFTVLVRTNMASALIEVGYLSNAGEEAKLKTQKYQLLAAQGMYKGILKYYE